MTTTERYLQREQAKAFDERRSPEERQHALRNYERAQARLQKKEAKIAALEAAKEALADQFRAPIRSIQEPRQQEPVQFTETNIGQLSQMRQETDVSSSGSGGGEELRVFTGAHLGEIMECDIRATPWRPIS